ncbi:MAG: DNA ligase (NAD(+)) LigA, partial [Spirochaetales bacterium]|nr:DNA ligase (NAD(+)) LigA [Spirochaetales bacterium]
MDIEGFGPETINFLFDKGFIQDIPDLYAFNYLELIGEEGFGEKKSSALAKAIEESKKGPFRSVLVALGIADFGKKGVDLLVDSGIKTVQTLFELIDSSNRDYF